jgi:hypothetical protein
MKSNLYHSIFAAFIAGCFVTPVTLSAQEHNQDQSEPIPITRITAPVTLDGISDEAAWEGIPSFPMRQRMPNYDTEPTERTEFLVGYDDEYLYAAGRFYVSDPSQIQSVSFERDLLTASMESMCLILDTFNDNENGVFFMTSNTGNRTDANIMNDAVGAVNLNWNTFWDVATAQNDDGWFAEMRIPFSSLRFEERNGQIVMGMTAFRWIPAKSESIVFPLMPMEHGSLGNYKPSLTQEVVFEGIQRRNPLYVTPYVLGGKGHVNTLNTAETAYTKDEKDFKEAGLDVRYGLTDNLTLNVTANTDFAQVEADDQQINLTRYSLFFPEKRMFFQERSGNFDFKFEDDNRLFHSRRIGLHEGEQVRIFGGTRIVGRMGPWDVGFLNMQTEEFESLPSENFGIIRLRRQVLNENSYVGGMFTSRIGAGDLWNTAYGIDGIFKFSTYDYLMVKWAQSFENDLQNEPLSMDLSKIFLDWERRSIGGLGYHISYARSGKDFNPGIGYERRDDYSRFGDRLQYGWLPGKTSRLQNHQVFIDGVAFLRNADGSVENSEIDVGWKFATKNYSSGTISVTQYREDVTESISFSDATDVPEGKYIFYGINGQFKPLGGSLTKANLAFTAGSFYDGRRGSAELKYTISPSPHIKLEPFYQINRVEFPDREQELTGHIGRFRILLSYDTRHSISAFTQYNSSSDNIFSNVRYRYNPSEGVDFYIVYDECFNTDRHRDILMRPLTRNRTVLLKYNYTFQL